MNAQNSCNPPNSVCQVSIRVCQVSIRVRQVSSVFVKFQRVCQVSVSVVKFLSSFCQVSFEPVKIAILFVNFQNSKLQYESTNNFTARNFHSPPHCFCKMPEADDDEMPPQVKHYITPAETITIGILTRE